MANAYLVSTLLDALRDTGMFPTADESFTTSRLIAVMNREQRLYLSRLLVELGDAYQVTHADVALVAGQTRYRIPSRAVVAGLQLVEKVSSTSAVPLHEVPRARVFDASNLGVAADYYIEGYELVFLMAPEDSSTLRFHYFRRLSDLVPAEEVGEVQSIDTANKQVTLVSAPSAFTSSARYDFVQGSPHFDALGVDLSATVVGTVLTFVDALPDELAEGDYVALAGQTPICQAPIELHDVLVQRACVAVLQAKGDPKATMAEQKLAEMRDDAVALLQRRVKAAPELILNYNAPGWNRYARGRRFRRF